LEKVVHVITHFVSKLKLQTCVQYRLPSTAVCFALFLVCFVEVHFSCSLHMQLL